MGCRFECHIYQDDENNIIDFRGSGGNSSNKQEDLIIQSNLLNQNEKEIKLNKIKNNLQNKLSEIGIFIPINEFKPLINPKINEYMQTNKLDIQNLLPSNISTFKPGPIKFKNNIIYNGSWNKNYQMEGQGIIYIPERKIIAEGLWVQGNIIYGRIFFPNGDIYEGKMKNSLPDGEGKLNFANGESYEGDFKQGEMTGQGIFIFSDKTIYIGDIEKGLFNGKGKMKWDNGTEYEGTFIDSSLSGEGIIFNSYQNESYQGMFEKNEFNGNGIYYYKNGDIYKGNFEFGIKRGNGKYIKGNEQIIFNGIWNADLPNGNGIITYKGNSLKGFWRNGIYIEDKEIEENINDNFYNIRKDIKPFQNSLIPNSLPHLSSNDSNVSKLYPENFI